MEEDSYVGAEHATSTSQTSAVVATTDTRAETSSSTATGTKTKTKAAKAATTKGATAVSDVVDKANMPTKLSKFIQRWLCLMAVLRCPESSHFLTKKMQENWVIEKYTAIAREFIKRSSNGEWTGPLFSVFTEMFLFTNVTFEQLMNGKGSDALTAEGVIKRGKETRCDVSYQ
jgi:hypothetical protein